MGYAREDLVGNKYTNGIGLVYEVVSYEGRDKHGISLYKVRFVKTGYERVVCSSNIKKGYVRDVFNVSVCGVGYLGEIVVSYTKREYSKWAAMLSRCYNEDDAGYTSYGAKGVRVSDDWLCFANYIADIKGIPGYSYDKVIDKDILSGDSKIYSRDTVSFVTQEENNAHIDNSTKLKSVIVSKPDGTEDTCKSIAACCAKYGLLAQNVVHCLKGRRTHSYGLTFRYAEDKCND